MVGHSTPSRAPLTIPAPAGLTPSPSRAYGLEPLEHAKVTVCFPRVFRHPSVRDTHIPQTRPLGLPIPASPRGRPRGEAMACAAAAQRPRRPRPPGDPAGGGEPIDPLAVGREAAKGLNKVVRMAEGEQRRQAEHAPPPELSPQDEAFYNELDALQAHVHELDRATLGI